MEGVETAKAILAGVEIANKKGNADLLDMLPDDPDHRYV